MAFAQNSPNPPCFAQLGLVQDLFKCYDLVDISLVWHWDSALDGFLSTVERNGTGTGRNGTGPGKMSHRFAINGTRFLPVLLNGCQRQNSRFLPFSIISFAS